MSAYASVPPAALRDIDAMASLARQINTTASGSFTTVKKLGALKVLLQEVGRLAASAEQEMEGSEAADPWLQTR